MCGRYANFTPVDDLASHFKVDEVRTEPLPPRYNVAPTLEVYSVIERRGSRRLGTLRWGFVPPFAKDLGSGAKAINARAETVATSGMFKEALLKRRCLLPADAFYEWKKRPGGGRKQPYLFRRGDGIPIAFAGIWSYWRDPTAGEDADPVYSCAIITTKADDVVGAVHDRMPVVLEPDEWEAWLAPDGHDVTALRGLLVPRDPSPLVTHPVSTLVSDVRNDGPELIEELHDVPDGP